MHSNPLRNDTGTELEADPEPIHDPPKSLLPVHWLCQISSREVFAVVASKDTLARDQDYASALQRASFE